jgi:signal transduction histidine kinase
MPERVTQFLSRPLVRYGIALLAVALAMLLRWSLQDLFGKRFIYVTFFQAVALVALLADWRASLLTLAASVLVMAYYFTQPKAAATSTVTAAVIENWADIAGLALFSISSLLICITAGLRDLARRREMETLKQTHELAGLAAEISLAEERERRRLAGLLHDGIGQTLTFCCLRLEKLRPQAAQTELAQPLDELQKTLKQIINDARDLAFEMSPPVLYEVGLGAALKSLAENIQMQSGIACTAEAVGGEPPIDNDLRAFLYQAARELVVNAVKHAHGKAVRMKLEHRDGKVMLTVQDDGRGFKASAQGRNTEGGFGLFSLRERIKHLGGRCEINSRPGAGTKAVVDLPLAAAADLERT